MKNKGKYFVWGIACLVALLNIEPAIKLGILGQVTETALYVGSPPEWAFPAFGLSSVAVIVLAVFTAFEKRWAPIILLVICLPHAYTAFLVTGFKVGFAAVYLVASIALAISSLVLSKPQHITRTSS